MSPLSCFLGESRKICQFCLSFPKKQLFMSLIFLFLSPSLFFLERGTRRGGVRAEGERVSSRHHAVHGAHRGLCLTTLTSRPEPRPRAGRFTDRAPGALGFVCSFSGSSRHAARLSQTFLVSSSGAYHVRFPLTTVVAGLSESPCVVFHFHSSQLFFNFPLDPLVVQASAESPHV